MRFLALLLCAFASPLHADPDRISMLIGTRHVGASGFNESNLGLFLTWERSRVDWSVGAYENSYGRTSVAVTAFKPLLRWHGGEAGVFAGAAHYPKDGRNMRLHVGDVVPLFGAQLRHKNTFFQVMPMDGKPVDGVVSFGVTVEFEN